MRGEWLMVLHSSDVALGVEWVLQNCVLRDGRDVAGM